MAEVAANLQIINNRTVVKMPSSKVTITKHKYELIDSGPVYLRSAIKTVVELKLVHLSLPDNLLGYQEAKTIAAMIDSNPPLKHLDLRNNLFCWRSG